MPRPPSWINQVNAIINFVENPCNAPWALYFETALPAAGEAIVTLLDFGFDDVVRGALRPRGLRNRRHLRRGRRGRRGGGGIPEIGELIGAAIPGTKEVRGRKVTQGVKNFWLLDGVIQRILWYWLVVDVTLLFFYEWTSAIQKSEFCSMQNVGAALAESPEEAFWFAPANAWTSMPISEVQYATGGADARFASCQNDGRPFSHTVSVSVSPLPVLPNGTMEIRYFDGDTDEEVIVEATVDKDGMHNIVAHANSRAAPVIYSYRTNGGAFEGQGTAFVMGL